MPPPDTVTILECPNGSTVYLVGTAHFSPASVEDVKKTINDVIEALDLVVPLDMLLCSISNSKF